MSGDTGLGGGLCTWEEVIRHRIEHKFEPSRSDARRSRRDQLPYQVYAPLKFERHASVNKRFYERLLSLW